MKNPNWFCQGQCFGLEMVSLGTAYPGVSTCQGYTASEAEPGSLQIPAIQMGMQCL